MDNDGAKRLASAVVLQAALDLDSAHKKAIRLHKACCHKGGECNTKNLIDYLAKLKKKNQYSSLPFEEDYEKSAVRFFTKDDGWRKTLFDLCEIRCLPAEFRDKAIMLECAYRKCIPCIAKCKRYATRRLKNERELTAAE